MANEIQTLELAAREAFKAWAVGVAENGGSPDDISGEVEFNLGNARMRLEIERIGYATTSVDRASEDD